MNTKKTPVLFALLGVLLAPAALAHTPYLSPASYEPLNRDWVTLDAAFTDYFFVPDIVFDNDTFAVQYPSGAWQPITVQQQLNTRTVLEHQLTERGTHRFSTGERHGAVFRIYEHEGERHSTRDPDETLPEGAQLIDHFQAITLAEVYISFRAFSDTVLQPRGQGLELVPLNHPNELFAGQTFDLRLLFAGNPLANEDLEVFVGDGKHYGHDGALTFPTDNKGRAQLTLPQPGRYLARVRYRTDAPAGAPAPRYSYTYTLSFEILPNEGEKYGY